MTEPTERIPPSQHPPAEPAPQMTDPRDLVYAGGWEGDIREIVENPAVTPEMLNEPGDLRQDLLEED